MKRIAAVLLLTATAAFAQTDVSKLINGNQGSPESIASIHYAAGQIIWIFYHAPSVKGRHVFNGAGALQPDGSVWRLGADNATLLHTDADLDIGGVAVPKGEYTLYIDLDKGAWKLIINKNLKDARGRSIWGINMDGSTTDNPSTELGRAPMTMSKPSAPVETLKIALVRNGDKGGKIDIAWENVAASVLFTLK